MHNNNKYIGIVKWFRDNSREANYGFIQHPKLGDVFFHEKSIDDRQNINLFGEDLIVVFKVQESIKHKGKIEAFNVQHLDNETDLIFLFSHFLMNLTEIEENSIYKRIKNDIYSRINLLVKESTDLKLTKNLFDLFQKYFAEQIHSKSINDEFRLKEHLQFARELFPDDFNEIASAVEKNFSSEILHRLWLDGFVESCQINYLSGIIITETESEVLNIRSRCSEKDLEQIFKIFKDHVTKKLESNISDVECEKILRVSKLIFSTNYKNISNIVESSISIELAHDFWLNGLLETCQVNYISDIILSEEECVQKLIFEKCTQSEKSRIFSKILSDLDKVSLHKNNKLNRIREVLNLSNKYAKDLHTEVSDKIIKVCSDYDNLNLWLEGYHDFLDFHSYKIFTYTLSVNDQRKFVKKVLKYIHEEKVNISIDDLTSLNLMDFETSKIAEEINNSKLDYSTSVILKVISDLKNQNKLQTKKDVRIAKHKIYDLIIKQIKNPTDILEITGFFDECGGRCNVSVKKFTNSEGFVYNREVKFNRNEYNKAKNHPICDGRKAVNKHTKEPLLSEENLEYWWCANQKCFKPSRELHSSEQWDQYTLWDFLSILRVDFDESDLEIYLNIINKANRFFKHLNCRECKHILYPKGRSNYAFYGVNLFACQTEGCSKKDMEIYLSHCLNSNCEMEIDSRDSVKCKPQGFESESCGWYVCNYCNSCCTTEQLQKRKWVHDNINHSEYKCHSEGHRNLGIISCNKCGNSMEGKEPKIDEHNRILNWFLKNKDKSNRIIKYGKNKYNKHWFLINKGNYSMEEFNNKLIKYRQIGFQIPDIEEHKETQLISEPFDLSKQFENILSCGSCGHVIDLSSDPEKSNAVKRFHNVRFPEIK